MGPYKEHLPGIVEYVPNLFTIFVIWLAVKYLVRLVHYLASEIQSERLEDKWLLCRLGYANVSHCAFPALCIYDCYDLSLSASSKSGVFRDIGLCRLDCFVASSTVIGNIIADW